VDKASWTIGKQQVMWIPELTSYIGSLG